MEGWIGLDLAWWVAAERSVIASALWAGVLSLLAALASGPPTIDWLARRTRTRVRDDSRKLAQLQADKPRTPGMGGLFLIGALLLGILCLGDWHSTSLWIVVLATVGFAVLGAIDDLTKLTSDGRGLSLRTKLLSQCGLAALIAAAVYFDLKHSPGAMSLAIPGLAENIELGAWLIPLAALVLVATSNAVNLTDGLDGLAGGCLLFLAVALAVIATAVLPTSPRDGQMLIALGALVGAVLGFLWFNVYPARVFMGDTGSLPLGALIGLIAVYLRQELLLVLLAGVFVAEAASVLIQVAWYRWTRRRVFRCAPLHHHFQFLGWSEQKVVTRFWIASALCATLAVALVGWQHPGGTATAVKGRGKVARHRFARLQHEPGLATAARTIHRSEGR